MTDEEFERLKEAEKDHLRKKKRLRATLETLKKRTRAESVVQQMKRGAERLLDETESLVDALRRAVAQREARVEGALGADDASLREAEHVLREERAETLLRQYKAAQSSSAPSSRPPDASVDDASEDDASEADAEGPEKTIGRMRTPRS